MQEASSQVEELLAEGLDRLDLDVADPVRTALVSYCLELLKWNKKINLVARDTSPADLVDKHFLDSLTLVPLLAKYDTGAATLLDVGSGAGFPGLVVAVACPGLTVTLLEPRRRRSIFLRHVVRHLDLKNVTVVASRLEKLDPPRKPFSVITGRGVAEMEMFLAMVAPVATPSTTVLCMQGAGGRRGVVPGDRLGEFFCRDVRELLLPFSRVPRFLISFVCLQG